MALSLAQRLRTEESRRQQAATIRAKAKQAREEIARILHCKESSNGKTPTLNLGQILATSDEALRGFATLDDTLISSIFRIRHHMEDYKNDPTKKRPYNILMLAPPGSGKSHFIQCLTGSLDLPAVIGNLSNPATTGVMSLVINEARNHKALDKIPVLFLDEIDSNPDQLPSFLPLLWDGEFSLIGQRLQLGKCIIICAISDEKLERYVKLRRGRRHELKGFKKLDDFLSRFDGGVFEIPPLGVNRRSDKLCIAMKLLRRRFEAIKGVQIGFIQFLVDTPFVHEVRSLEFFINSIPPALEKSLLKINELMDRKVQVLLEETDYTLSPFGQHILPDERASALARWKKVKQNTAYLMYKR